MTKQRTVFKWITAGLVPGADPKTRSDCFGHDPKTIYQNYGEKLWWSIYLRQETRIPNSLNDITNRLYNIPPKIYEQVDRSAYKAKTP
jgi:hypothetical protein